MLLLVYCLQKKKKNEEKTEYNCVGFNSQEGFIII